MFLIEEIPHFINGSLTKYFERKKIIRLPRKKKKNRFHANELLWCHTSEIYEVF